MPGVLLTLWRAAAVFRVVALLICLYLIVRWRHLYAEPGVAFGVGGAMVAVTCVVAGYAVAGRAHRLSFVVADAAVCAGLTLLTRVAQHPRQYHGTMVTLTSIWAAGPAIEAGLLLGMAGGLVAALVQFGASVVVREGADGRTFANGAILLIVGGIAGFVATFAARAEQQRAEAAAALARMAERQRLTRTIHDGVLQVLALVHRRGAAAGPEWAELAQEAAVQEAALRALITSEPRPAPPPGRRDIAADLVQLRSPRVVVSVPETPVVLPARAADELTAVLCEALRNVERHAGPDATTWLFVEELPDEVVVTVRDDGVGIPAGRLDEAAGEGRLGVPNSMRGRVAELGGRVTITSVPGEGTEIEIVLPADASGGAS